GRPMIIVYRLSWLTYWIARCLVRVRHIGMVNLIAEERLMPELIQSDVNPERLAAESRALLEDAKARARMTEQLARLRERLGSPGPARGVPAPPLGMMPLKKDSEWAHYLRLLQFLRPYVWPYFILG